MTKEFSGVIKSLSKEVEVVHEKINEIKTTCEKTLYGKEQKEKGDWCKRKRNKMDLEQMTNGKSMILEYPIESSIVMQRPSRQSQSKRLIRNKKQRRTLKRLVMTVESVTTDMLNRAARS